MIERVASWVKGAWRGPWGPVLRTLTAGVLSAIVFVVAHPPMWRGDGHGVGLFPGGALTGVHWADLAFARASVADGVLPLWNPWDGGGYAFFAEPHGGMFDPVTWAVVGLGVVIGGAPAWLAVLKAVLHFGIAGAGFAAFFRERRLPPWAVALGTLALLWSPRLDEIKDQAALWPTAWAGWLLLATDRVLRAPSRWRGLWLGAAIGTLLNAGHPPAAFVIGLLVAPWAFVVFAQRVGLVQAALGLVDTGGTQLTPDPNAAAQRGLYLRGLAEALGIAIAVAFALSAGQLWARHVSQLADEPALQVAQRVVGGIAPSHAWRLFAPGDTVATVVLYGGFALAAAALVAVVAKRRAEPLTFAVVGVFGFLLACGDQLPLMPALRQWPGFRLCHEPAEFQTLTTLALVVAGTFGVARIARLKGEWRWLGGLAAGFGGSAWATHSPAHDATSLLVIVVSAALLAALGLVAAHRQARVGWALVAVVAFDLWHVGRPIAGQLEPLPKVGRDEIMIAALGGEDARSVYRVADFGWAGARIGPRARVRDIAGQRAAVSDPRHVELFSLAQRSSNMLRAMNVAVAGFSKKVSGSELTRDLRAIRKQRRLLHVEDPWPLAYWTDRVAVVDKHPEARVWLRMQREPAAVLERPDLPSDFDAAHWGTHLRDDTRPQPRSRGAQLLVQAANHLVLRIDAPRAGMLVVLEGYAPGWEATVDGETTALVRANVIFRAVPVEAGEHQVVLSYHPRGVVPLWALWLLSCIGLAVAGGVAVRRHIRADSAELPRKPIL